MNATGRRRAAVAFPAVWLPWVLVSMSAAAALFGAWWIWGTQAAIAFLSARWPWLLIGASGTVTLSVFVWWLWWRLPKRQVDRLSAAITDAKARTDVEDSFRKTAGQLLGGAAVLIGAAIAYVQFMQQQQAAHDLLISNQVAKGFELLGHKDRSEARLRLGGIYALEGVMNTSEQYHQPVLEALCAFVRDETYTKADDDNAAPVTEIQAALTVIGRRKAGAGEVNLTGAHIPGASLSGANLSGAGLNGVNLSGAGLSGANLSGANLSGANLSAAGLINANLSGADLINADLSAAFLSGANLSTANLSRANLSVASLIGANLSRAFLFVANLSDANLSGANLIGGNNNSLTQGQLDRACGDEKTKLDPPLTIKPCKQQ
jgi:uncharacterized protein YjbI with pentapeptide repeats